MFVACGIWCLADVSSVSPSSEQTGNALEWDFSKRGKCSGMGLLEKVETNL